MEIGGIGFFNTISSSVKEGTLSTEESGFKGLVGLFLSESTSQGINNPLAEERSLDIPADELVALIDFLGAEDILDVEDGLNLLKQAQAASNPEELLQIIAETIEPNVNVKELIQSFQQSSSMPIEGEISEPNQSEAEEIKVEDLLAILTQFNSMPLDELKGAAQKDMVQLVKIVKIFELLAPEQNVNNDQRQLKDLVQQLTKKFEGFLESANLTQKDDFTKQNSRQEYLLKTFSSVASELNQNKKHLIGKLLGESSTESKSLSVKNEPVNGIVQFHQISKAEQFTMTLQQSGKPTGTNDLIKQFENILAKSQFSNVVGTQKLLIKLNPEHLGALRIELIQKDAGMVAKILATTKLAKETLESHIQGLKHAFASQNILVDKLEIAQSANQSMERFLNKEQQQQSQQQQQQEQPEQNNGSNSGAEEHTFVTSLEEALINQKV
ncbi:flagellar hook-length control protein FliK [Robertmurraya massiliosenegalensis]|uniref:flagellar hook-length control protein FliK n=1 Tax=Robertmurraya TaxID=2837507 RepID=UPI0039A61D91